MNSNASRLRGGGGTKRWNRQNDEAPTGFNPDAGAPIGSPERLGCTALQSAASVPVALGPWRFGARSHLALARHLALSSDFHARRTDRLELCLVVRRSAGHPRTLTCGMGRQSARHQQAAGDSAPVLPRQREPRPNLRPSERELRAFLSSVMEEPLREARQVVVDALDGVPFLAPWAFEYTPASSEAVDSAYLRHVRDADLVIWLASADVSTPVANEVREALAARKRLIIVRYGSGVRSIQCQGLLDEVGLRAKYADAETLDELRSSLEMAIGDEMVRSWRGQPDMGRLALIDALGSASLARCTGRWQAPGLPRGEAITLAADPTIGALPEELAPTSEAPVVVLSTEMGAGKSLAADRHLQVAIARLLGNGSEPVPVWLAANQARNGLQAAVMSSCEGLGDPRLQGATVIVDGLDETGIDAAEELLGAARELATMWPQTTVLLTSRPLPALAGQPEHRSLPELDSEQSAAIMAIGAGQEIPFVVRNSLPEPVQRSARRPLFALLYGLTRRGEDTLPPRSPGDLLAFLGREARRRAGADAESLLRKLAVESICRDLGPVAGTEIGRHDAIDPLLASGLVSERPGGLVLGLPVITQWFAAQALTLDEVDLGRLLDDPGETDLWLYPLAIAVATATHEDASRLLGPILRAAPGFGFRVIDEALGSATLEGITAPPWRVAGLRMLESIQALADGLGDLAELTLPMDEDGHLRPLGVCSSGEHVDYAFWVGRDDRESPFRLDNEHSLFNPDPDLTMVGFAAVGRGSAWAWRWSRDRVRHELGQLFKYRALPCSAESPLEHERLWQMATGFENRGSVFAEPVELAPMLETLDELIHDARREGARAIAVASGGSEFDAIDLRDALERFVDRGETALPPPHPGADQRPTGGGMVGRFYSDERLLARTISIYEAALVGYRDLVDTSFSSLADRLALYVTLPARFVGHLDPNDAPTNERVAGLPVLSSYFEALPADAQTTVDITISRDEQSLWADRTLLDRLRSLRPDASRWINSWMSNGILPIASLTPSTALAYGWLWRDLAHTKIVSGMRPDGSRDI